MLRLGSKYEINHLREDALFRLRADFPTTLDNWDELCGHKHILEEDGILYDLINLAIEQGLWSILPAAYYFCILDGNDVGLYSPILPYSEHCTGRYLQRPNARRRIKSCPPS